MDLKTLAMRRAAAVMLFALVAISTATGVASAAPVTFTHPSGASVTLSSATYAPGGRVEIQGSGFTPAGGQGNPILAFKPDLQDDEAMVASWHVGGPSALPPTDLGGGEYVLQFAIELNGTFGGWVDLPQNLAIVGPGGSPHAGEHYLQLLCGVLSTGSNPCTEPVSFPAFFGVVDLKLGQVGTNGPSAGTFYRGARFPASASVVVRGSGLAASTPVVITLDGQSYSTTSFSTTVAGSLPDDARITLPSDLVVGTHAVQLSIGAQDVPMVFTVAPRPAATVTTPSVPAGGTLTMHLENWLGIGASGQKVALKLGSLGADTLACVQADARGAADVSVAVPAAMPVGTTAVFLLAGTNCIAGGEQSDLPARILVPQPTFSLTSEATPSPPPPPATSPSHPLTPPAAPPAVPPPPAATVAPRITAARLTSKGRKLRVTLSTGTATRATFTAKSAGKVRIGGKGARSRTVTVTKSLTVALTPGEKAATVALTLTADGRKALTKLRRLSVVLRVAPAGGTSSTKRLTLKA